MGHSLTWRARALWCVALIGTLALSGPSAAAPPEGKGGGKKDGDTGRGVAVSAELANLGGMSGVGGPYVAAGDDVVEIRNDTGDLRFGLNKSNERTVLFDFSALIGDDPVNASGDVWCRTLFGEHFTVPAPAFLVSGTDLASTVTFGFRTGDELLTEENGVTLDLLAMTDGEVAFAELFVRFQVPEEKDRFFRVDFGSRNPGMVMVTALDETGSDGVVDAWLLTPLPDASDPLQHVAHLWEVGVSSGKGRDKLSGTCELGDYDLPFALTLRRLE